MSGKKPSIRMGKQPAVQAVPDTPTPVSEPITKKDQTWIAAYAVLLFLAMTVQTGAMTLFLTVLALVLSVGKGPLKHFRARFCIPVIGLLAFALMNGLAAIYSDFGSYAVGEYYKFLAAFSMAVILLARFEKKHVRGLLWGFAGVAAVISLLCIDMGSFGKLFDLFAGVMDSLGADYSSVLENSQGIRVNGIYNDANVTGALLGTAVLLGLHLVHTERDTRRRVLASLLMGVSAVGFLIAMSRGAILCFGVAALVYLAAVDAKDRFSLFALMLALGVSLAATGAVAMTHMAEGAFLPVLMALLCGGIAFLLDWGVGQRVARKLSGHGKAVAAVCVGLILVVCGLGFAAMQVTEPYVFEDGSHLYRSLALEPGEYTVSGDWDGEDTTNVLIYSRSDEEALMNQTTTLYRGTLADARFTVPEDSVLVFFWFTGAPGDTLRSVSLSDGHNVPLSYRWVPEMIAYRLQEGFLHGHSYLLRVQFMKDAWTLFTKSPLIGHGLGSTEGLYTAVQPFYYESLYVHNHILQVMSDMGLLGLLSFLALLAGALWLIVCQLRSEQRALPAMLLACWVMINTHSIMEINFSIRAFQCFAYPLLLLPVVLYGKPMAQKAVKRCGLAAAGFVWAYLAVFGGLLASHRMVQQAAADFTPSSAYQLMHTMETYTQRDVFDHEQHQLNYVGNAVLLNDSSYAANAEKYVKALRSSGTYTACSGLARYYYLPLGEFEELFACSREGIAQEASAKESWNLQLDFYRNEVLPTAGAEHIGEFMDGVLALRDYLTEYSQGRLEEIQLTEENQSFLSMVSSAEENGISGEAAYVLLTTLAAGASESTTP